MTVYLVGAGPGDPELLTVKAARLLATAEVVVYDRLVSPQILALVSPWAELIPVGKDPGGRSTTQSTINAHLISWGRAAEIVVRLKGGDPYVFGRGGEEALALNTAGVRCEVVPGISSALAGPALGGIPITHRAISRGFTVVTGQSTTSGKPINWEALAASGTTLVVLMGARLAADIRERLVAGGMDPDTPAAVVTWATTPKQSTQRMRLGELGRQSVVNPSVIIVGAVADFDLRSTVDGDLVAIPSPAMAQAC